MNILKISKEIKTALLVLVSIALLLWGYNFLNGKNIFDNSRKFYVEYDNVEGLTTASAVTINGLVVGKVNHITIQPNGKLMVEMMMTNPVEFPKTSKAIIYAPGLIGGKQISIVADYASKDIAKSGDFLVPGVELGMLDGLGAKADPVMQKLDSVLFNVNKLVIGVNSTLDPVAQKNLQNAMAELNQTMINARGITTKFDRIVTNNEGRINAVVSDFNVTSKNLNKLSTNLSQTDLNAIVTKFDHAATTLNELMASIDRGEGNIGKLVKDETLYKNLNKASKELSQLIEDVKLNPKRYVSISVFGKNAGPYVAPDTLKK